MTTRTATAKTGPDHEKTSAGGKRKPTLSSQELFLVRQYAREGGTEDRLPRAARRARVTIEHARTLLKRPHVQHELALYQQILRQEQARIDAADIDRSQNEEDKLLRETERKAIRKLDALIEADPTTLTEQHLIQMRVLKFGLVVTGTIREGRTERITPPEGQSQQGNTQVPGSFFGRGMVSAEEAAPLYGAASAALWNDGPRTTDPGPATAAAVAEPAGNDGPLEVKVGKSGRTR
jgi:hypothetical protein